MRSAGNRSDARALVDRALANGLRSLDEHQAKMLLAAYGVPVPDGELAGDEEAAVQAARHLRTPVALKAVGPSIRHKSEGNLVALNVDGDSGVRLAYRRLVGLVDDPQHTVLVERMLHGPRELMVGMKRDGQFGPVVLFGVGGIFAEAHDDIALAVTPLDDEDARSMLTSIRARSLLDGIRGLPPVDHDALIAVMRAIGQIAVDFPEIVEIDVNPLIIEGAGPVAADALVILQPVKSGQSSAASPATRPMALEAVFYPRSLAIVGATRNPLKWGGSLLDKVLGGGFRGDVYPVNGRGGKVRGLTAYRGLDELPTTPDLVLVALGANRVEDVVDECVRLRVPAAVVVTAGFSETGARGAAAEAAVAAKADAGGLTLIGPNCNGVFSAHGHLHAVGYLQLHPGPGRVSIVSQSGTVGFQMLTEAARRGIGIDKYIAVGNEASTGALDVLDALREDRRTGVAIVYLEGIEDGARFMAVMRRVTPHTPVVVLRGGLTDSGSRAAASHTAAMAGSADVFMAAARQSGCLVRLDPDEGLDLALCLAHVPIPRGPRVAVLTLGGGWGVLTTDELVRCGLCTPPLPSNVLSGLDELLPSYWSRANPVDMVSAGDVLTTESALRLLADSDGFDAIVVLSHVVGRGGISPSSTTSLPAEFNAEAAGFLEKVGDVMDRTGKPIICVALDPIDRALYDERDGASPVVLPSPLRAARALSGLVEYGAYRETHASARSSQWQGQAP